MARHITYGAKKEGAEIVCLILAKLNSKITFTEEDALLQLFLDAATDEIENYVGRPVLERPACIISETRWCSRITIPFEVNELISVEWLDDAEAATELTEGEDFEYFGNELEFDIDEPADFARLRITVNAGYPAAEMPNDIKRAALLIFSHADTYRENMPVKLNTSAQALLRPYRRY